VLYFRQLAEVASFLEVLCVLHFAFGLQFAKLGEVLLEGAMDALFV